MGLRTPSRRRSPWLRRLLSRLVPARWRRKPPPPPLRIVLRPGEPLDVRVARLDRLMKQAEREGRELSMKPGVKDQLLADIYWPQLLAKLTDGDDSGKRTP